MNLSNFRALPKLAAAQEWFNGIRSSIVRCSPAIPTKSIDFPPSSTPKTLFDNSCPNTLSGAAKRLFTKGNTRITPKSKWTSTEFHEFRETADQATAQAIGLVREALKLDPDNPHLLMQLSEYLSTKSYWVGRNTLDPSNVPRNMKEMDVLLAETLVVHTRGVNLLRKVYSKNPSIQNAQALIDAIEKGLGPWDSFSDIGGDSSKFHKYVSEILDIASKHNINIDGIKNRLQDNHMRQFRNGFYGPSSSWKRFPNEAILRDVSPNLVIDRFNALANQHGITPLGENPTRDQLKTAYRALSMQLHPDTSGNPSTVTQFKELSGIYQTLQEHLN